MVDEINDGTEPEAIEEVVENQSEITENPEEAVSEQVEETVEERSNDDLPRGIKRRFDKMTQQKYEALERIEQLERKLAEAEQAKNQKSREDYSDDEWIEKVAQDKAEALLRQREDAIKQELEAKRQSEQKQQSWVKKVESLKDDIPDFNDVISKNADVELPREVLRAVTESDIGPKLAYHFALNPQDADKMWELDSRGRDRFLTRLEIKLEDKSYAKKAEVTKATPTPKSKGGSSSNNSIDNLSIDDWMKARNRKVRGR